MILLTPADGPECPRCGCRDSKILAKPEPKSWFRRFGRARCGYCETVFSFKEAGAGDETGCDPANDAIGDDPGQLIASEVAAIVPRSVPVCAECRIEMRVSSTRKAYRWYKCPRCGSTRKVAKEA